MDLFKTLGNALRPHDFQTSTVSGAEAFERGNSEHEEIENGGEREEEECEDSEADDCYCSDPWCPCGGKKRGY
jgi:hypothetical protein